MKNASILVVWSLFFCMGCESGGDAHRSAGAPAPSAEGMISDGTSAKEPGNAAGGREAVSSSQLDQALELQSGVYGLPFGATTDEVMKWCADNNMAVANPTEKKVKEAARNAVARINGLKEAYDLEVESLAPLEQELVKLAQGYAETRDIFELAKIAAAAEKLDVLKNPTISYEGQKYYLVRVHKSMKVDVDNDQKICTDDRITRTAYRLTLTPTAQSESMVASGLASMDVLLYGDVGQELGAYATVAIVGGNAQRNANTNFGLVLTAISEKYGTPESIPRWRPNSVSEQSCEIITEGIHELLGTDCGISFSTSAWAPNLTSFADLQAIVWARNLVLFGDLHKTSEPPGIALEGSRFWLFYYDHEAAAHIFELHAKALADFEKNYREKKKEAFAQVRQNF
jgi:hypothetical protein